MRNLLPGVLFVLGLAVGLTGCDPARVARLEEGVSTEAQVRQAFGEPVTVTVLPDGSKVMDYPRQPEGWTNYRISIGPDGRMSALRQLLHADNFAKITPGLDDNAVRERLGKPARVQRWEQQGEVEWAWRFRPDANRSQLFSVFFDRGGRVIRTAITDDGRGQSTP